MNYIIIPIALLLVSMKTFAMKDDSPTSPEQETAEATLEAWFEQIQRRLDGEEWVQPTETEGSSHEEEEKDWLPDGRYKCFCGCCGCASVEVPVLSDLVSFIFKYPRFLWWVPFLFGLWPAHNVFLETYKEEADLPEGRIQYLLDETQERLEERLKETAGVDGIFFRFQTFVQCWNMSGSEQGSRTIAEAVNQQRRTRLRRKITRRRIEEIMGIGRI